MTRPHHIETALAVLVETDGIAWADDRYELWRHALDDPATFPNPALLPVAARAYQRQRRVVGGHVLVDVAGFTAHYRGIAALEEASAPTPPPGPSDRPLAGDDALAALRQIRSSSYLARPGDDQP